MLALFLPVGILLGASLLILSSVSAHLFLLQLIWIALGIGVLFLASFIDWSSVLRHRSVIVGIYLLAIALLTFVYLKGPVIRNAKSWIILGPVSFQPVELAKIALILLYASYFSRQHLSVGRLKHIATSFLYFIIPAILVALQPNLGSAIVLFGLWYGTLLVSGLPLRRIMASILVFAVAGVLLWSFGLKDYQRKRIEGFFEPNKNTLGVNYNVTQSKIAFGSGGFWGKGYKQGSQVQLGFLSVPESDFVLAAFTEEWGLFGAFVVILSFGFLLYKIAKIAVAADHNFEKYICLGGIIIFATQFFINSASETGLIPVIGLTFPFLSYGGSSLITNFFILSMIESVRRKSV